MDKNNNKRSLRNEKLEANRASETETEERKAEDKTSLVPRPSYHGVPVRGPGNSGLRMRLIMTARYA